MFELHEHQKHLPESKRLRQWCRRNDIDLCILFGSRVTGKVHARSDTDIALWSARQPDLHLSWLRLNGELEDLFGYPVDLVILNRDSDPVLRLEIFQHGKPLFESQKGLFTEQHIVAVKIYDDTEPLRRLRDEVLARRIREWERRYVKDKHVTPKRKEQD